MRCAARDMLVDLACGRIGHPELELNGVDTGAGRAGELVGGMNVDAPDGVGDAERKTIADSAACGVLRRRGDGGVLDQIDLLGRDGREVRAVPLAQGSANSQPRELRGEPWIGGGAWDRPPTPTPMRPFRRKSSRISGWLHFRSILESRFVNPFELPPCRVFRHRARLHNCGADGLSELNLG